MLDSLLQADGAVFYYINHNLHNRVFDAIMPWITELGSNGAVWLFAMFLLAVFGKGPGRKITFLGTIALVASWVASDFVLKGLFARPRPFIHFPDTILLVMGPAQFSFPSGHTTTSFATATAVFGKDRRLGWAALALALLIGFSRVYVGVHYPLDVLGGIMLGCTLGYVVVKLEPILDKVVLTAKGTVRRLRGKGSAQ